jgi:SH3-like domain-containing protein
MRQGDYEEAHELLTEAIRLSPVYYEKAYDNLATLKKQMDAAGTATPAEAALRSNSGHIVVAEGQAPRKATVTAEILNVRSSPEADSDVVTHLKTGDPVEVIMTMPNWAFVNYRPAAKDANLTGWVNSRYVGSQEAKSTLMAAPELMATTDVSAPETATSPTVAAAPAQTEAAMETTEMEQATNASVPDLAIEEIVVTAPAAAEPLPATFADTTESMSGSIDAPLAAQTDTANTSPIFEAVTQ